MRSTGITRKFDNLGRLVIPKEIRTRLHLPECTPMEIFVEQELIILKPVFNRCACCGTSESLKMVENTSLCPKCIDKFNK